MRLCDMTGWDWDRAAENYDDRSEALRDRLYDEWPDEEWEEDPADTSLGVWVDQRIAELDRLVAEDDVMRSWFNAGLTHGRSAA